ncbi:MAG: MFS transporter [Gemmatimonadetes bacterium]|nr:MFS transporter [Gemmatimonadota bacterium]
MPFRTLFRPRPTLSDREVETGLRWLTWEGTASMGFGSIIDSGILAAFALMLGADNLQIGILAALPFLTMPLQLATVSFIEKHRCRKIVAVWPWFAAQLVWVPVALIPVFLDIPSAAAITALLVLVSLRGILTAIQNAAWNSWLRDLVPQERMGRFFARRLGFARVASMVFGLGAAVFVDVWRGQTTGHTQAYGYTIAMLAGALLLGLASPVFRTLMPEPLMQAPLAGRTPLARSLAAPLTDANYRRLLIFKLFWFFSLHLTVPFFAVYMLVRLGFPLSLVMGLSVLAQASNLLFLRMWGPLSDRVGHKVVLQMAASLYLLVILGWTFTTMPERYFLTVPLMVLLHIMAGAAAAGLDIASGTLGLKLAPRGRSTGYLAAMSVAVNIGAGIGPLAGGRLADFFSGRSLRLGFTWVDPSSSGTFPALSLTGYDFLFGITFLLGLLTLALLARVREEGEVSREIVLRSLMAPVQRTTSPASSVPGPSLLAHFPHGYLRRVPIPGFDVALGVTVYEVAEATRVATAAAARGRAAGARLITALEHAVTGLWDAGDGVEVHAAELARHAARGAAHAAADAGAASGRVLHQALHGIVGAIVRNPGTDPEEIIAAAAYGAVQGTVEAGADPASAAQHAMAAFREPEAPPTQLPGHRAERRAANGAMRALGDLAPTVPRRVSETSPRELA